MIERLREHLNLFNQSVTEMCPDEEEGEEEEEEKGDRSIANKVNLPDTSTRTPAYNN